MKKILIILLIGFAVAQNSIGYTIPKEDGNDKLTVPMYEQIIKFEDLAEYVIYCFSDSATVGYRFYLSDDGAGERYQEVYTKVEHPKFDYKNPIIYHVEKKGKTVYMSNEIRPPLGTIRKEEIKEPIEYPTFYGFFKWYLNKVDSEN